MSPDAPPFAGLPVEHHSPRTLRLPWNRSSRLHDLDPKIMIPAHGAPITRPRARIEAYRAHRLWREQRILSAVAEGPADLTLVTQRAYRDVSPTILWLAQRSALSHLRRLVDLGKVVQSSGEWRVADGPEPGPTGP